MIVNVRGQIVKWALYGAVHHVDFIYEEVRPLPFTVDPPHRMDCSFFAMWCYWRAGARDPSGNNFNGYGNSVSLFEKGKHIAPSKIKNGDIVVFGPAGETHAAVIVQNDVADPLTSSDGSPGAPQLVRVSALVDAIEGIGLPATPVTFLRFPTLNRRIRIGPVRPA